MITKLYHSVDTSLSVELPDEPYELRLGVPTYCRPRTHIFDYEIQDQSGAMSTLELIAIATEAQSLGFCIVGGGLDFTREDTPEEVQTYVKERNALITAYKIARATGEIELNNMYNAKHNILQ